MKFIVDSQIYELLSEAYPSTWNIDDFAKLTTFAARKRYCDERLQKLGSGSSRIVYKIDESKALKLAKNAKGISQNEVEIDSFDSYFSEILAEVFEYEPNYLWVEMELATPCTKSIFKSINGYSFENYALLLRHFHITNVARGKRYFTPNINEIPEAEKEKIYESDFYNNICDFVASYSIPVGDFLRPSSYGVVTGNGHKRVVLVDYGLNEDVFSRHYSR